MLDGTWTEWNDVGGGTTIDGVGFNLSSSGLAAGPKLRDVSSGGNDLEIIEHSSSFMPIQVNSG